MAIASNGDHKSKLLEEFCRNVRGRYEAMDTHDNKTQKRCIENMIRIIRELDTMPPQGRAALTQFLDSEELGLRVMAASYLLSVMPEKVLPILQDVEDNCYGDEAIDATTALCKYKWGDWQV
jgi:hypothetical protein